MKKLAQDLLRKRAPKSSANQSPDLSRRRLLTRNKQQTHPRLPWAIESIFTQACTRCNACIEKCPEQVIVQGEGGYPQIDFKLGECTFCYQCALACKNSPNASQTAIFLEEVEKPWQLGAQINESCLTNKNIECRSCQESCEPFAISFQLSIGSVAKPVIDHELCNGCGGCVSICPTQSIQMKYTD